MKSMVLDAPGRPLRLAECPLPEVGENDLLLEVRACGVCRTDLHIADGELKQPKLPLILGHEIVGVVAEKGARVEQFFLGQRVGVPWLGRTCGRCHYCLSGRENLCDAAKFTGYTLDGGYAEYALADQRYCFALPEAYTDNEAAPLLCAGLIGYRALVAAGDAQRLGLYGFGAAAHLLAQVLSWQKKEFFVFTRPGDRMAQYAALKHGALWAGGADDPPPEPVDAAILFAPVGALIPLALRHTVKGGAVICAGIHMSNIPEFAYELLWGERSIKSIANLTRQDGEAFLELASRAGVRSEIETFPLQSANEALQRVRSGHVGGAAVLVIER
jgi:propanol-preferring alcohol dehydrogenase